LPCFLRITQRLGIKLPASPEFSDWFERELMREFSVTTHEELRNVLTYYEMYRQEELKAIIQNILKRRQKKGLKEETLIV